jgi:DNA polymerase III subunit epsilon
MSSYVVIDFETANSDMSSICQIGIVRFQGGLQVDSYSTLVNPEDDFDWMNVSIHGIDKEDVKDAPKFPEVYSDILKFFGSDIVLSHGWFDLHAIRRVTEKYDLALVTNRWIDATKIVRRTLPEYSSKGYGLQNLAEHYSLVTHAHDALNDAYTCAVIVNKLLTETNTQIEEWLELSKKPIRMSFAGDHMEAKNLEPNPHGEHFGESLVFTGALSMVRLEAQKLASSMGFTIHTGVRKDTDYLVMGFQDQAVLHGHDKSAKQLKAEKLISDGLKIKLISEKDFIEICGLSL